MINVYVVKQLLLSKQNDVWKKDLQLSYGDVYFTFLEVCVMNSTTLFNIFGYDHTVLDYIPDDGTHA